MAPPLQLVLLVRCDVGTNEVYCFSNDGVDFMFVVDIVAVVEWAVTTVTV
jgi:hypothetical protein